MLKPISDRAEVAVDFPEKLFIGSFSQSSAFEVKADAENVMLKLVRTKGGKRAIELHLHYFLLAQVVTEMARELEEKGLPDEVHRRALRDAAGALQAAVAGPAA